MVGVVAETGEFPVNNIVGIVSKPGCRSVSVPPIVAAIHRAGQSADGDRSTISGAGERRVADHDLHMPDEFDTVAFWKCDVAVVRRS